MSNVEHTRVAAAAAIAFALTAIACGPPPERVTHEPVNNRRGGGEGEGVAAEGEGEGVIAGEGEGAGGEGEGEGSVGFPAPHPALPTLTSLGGPVLASPKVFLVFFTVDTDGNASANPFESDLGTFAGGLGATSYWSAVTSEYGVGPLASAGSVDLPASDVPPTSIDDVLDDPTQPPAGGVADFVRQHIQDGTFGVPDESTIYTVFYPASTTITISEAGQEEESCVGFGAYHASVDVVVGAQTLHVPYAIVPECDGFAGLSGIDVVTGATSHEWIEACTDPLDVANIAYIVDGDHLAWEFLLGGGEAGDLCANTTGAFFQPAGFPFTVQRSWSNAHAALGDDPCAPAAAASVYFQSAPVADDDVIFDGFPTKGVSLGGAAQKTIELDLYSRGPLPAWNVAAFDEQALFGGTPLVDFSFDTNTGANGDVLHLTITNNGLTDTEPFVIESVSPDDATVQLWPAMVAP